ncbi:hypothetical protein [Streptococcus respiraculi]
MKKKIIDLIVFIVLILVAIAGIRFLFFPAFGKIIETASPWYQEKVAISKRNQVDDAFSGVLGSKVDAISKDSISGWFSSREYKEIDFYIPKLSNTSALFRDDQYRDLLKDTLIASINTDNVEDQTEQFTLFYNGATIATWAYGRKTSTFRNTPADVRREVEEALRKTLAKDKKIEFKRWDFLFGKENVDFSYDPMEEVIYLEGVFLSSKGMFDSESYHVKAQYQKMDGKWHLRAESLEVEKND